ncbi:hypothetical protein TOK_3915 [Pseudonocardia sp. N23]|nr:hypothetical protein TOK_3915 [Pseudonocardia sp. N23]
MPSIVREVACPNRLVGPSEHHRTTADIVQSDTTSPVRRGDVDQESRQ